MMYIKQVTYQSRRGENEKSCVDVGVGGGVVLANAEINKLTLTFRPH